MNHYLRFFTTYTHKHPHKHVHINKHLHRKATTTLFGSRSITPEFTRGHIRENKVLRIIITMFREEKHSVCGLLTLVMD